MPNQALKYLTIAIFTLALLVWGGVGYLFLTQNSLTDVLRFAPTAKDELSQNADSYPNNNSVVASIQEYQSAYQRYRDDKGFTKDIPIIIFDVRSEKDYLQKHISKASLTPIDNLKPIANSGFLENKTVIVVVSDTTQETQARKDLSDSGVKELTVWLSTIMDTLSPDLIEENVEM